MIWRPLVIAETLSLPNQNSFATFVVPKPTSGSRKSQFSLNFKFRSAQEMGKMVRLPLLMSGFLELSFEIDSVGLSLVVNQEKIWHAAVKCVESSSSYDEWNQVSSESMKDNKSTGISDWG